jgi:hypothetical protein
LCLLIFKISKSHDDMNQQYVLASFNQHDLNLFFNGNEKSKKKHIHNFHLYICGHHHQTQQLTHKWISVIQTSLCLKFEKTTTSILNCLLVSIRRPYSNLALKKVMMTIKFAEIQCKPLNVTVMLSVA